MDEAYAVVEVIAGDTGRWTDFLFLEVNRAFMLHTGMPYPVGRTARQLLGTPNPRWPELYGRAAETGESIRVEETEFTLGRTFDLNIFPPCWRGQPARRGAVHRYHRAEGGGGGAARERGEVPHALRVHR